MAKTKKVGMAGRFGARYGARTRNNWRNIMERLKGLQKCPRCQVKSKNMREFLGVWSCPRCGARWTGGAWDAETERGKESVRISTRLAKEAQEMNK